MSVAFQSSLSWKGPLSPWTQRNLSCSATTSRQVYSWIKSSSFQPFGSLGILWESDENVDPLPWKMRLHIWLSKSRFTGVCETWSLFLYYYSSIIVLFFHANNCNFLSSPFHDALGLVWQIRCCLSRGEAHCKGRADMNYQSGHSFSQDLSWVSLSFSSQPNTDAPRLTMRSLMINPL